DLVRRLPDFARRQALDRAPHADLLAKLPAHAAFVDFLRYYRYEKDLKVKPVPHYVAFVLRQGQPVRRIELGPAKPIEEALGQWREDISNNLAGVAPEQLRRLPWGQLTPHLGQDTDTIYLSPDGALSGLPWAALPGRSKERVLLEDYTLALVPHGPFLLDQLTAPPRSANARDVLLAVGGVAYDQAPR